MGPERAAKLFLSEHPEADRIQVILYGSLSKTGVGHGTDRVLREVLSSVDNKIIYAQEDPEDMGHPNTMDFFAYQGETQTGHFRVESVGGGDIVILGRPADPNEEIYPENSFVQMALHSHPERIRRDERRSGNLGLPPGGLGRHAAFHFRRPLRHRHPARRPERAAKSQVPVRAGAAHRGGPGSGVPDHLLLCLRRVRAERGQRHHRHRPHLRRGRRPAVGSAVRPGDPRLHGGASTPGSGHRRHHRRLG